MLNLEILKENKKGNIITLVLVFGVVFLILFTSITGFILFQLRASLKRVSWEESLYVAEAGIDYYKWCLNNDAEGNCLNNKNYYDVYGNLIGDFSLDINNETSCGDITHREIISSGKTDRFPDFIRKIKVSYGRTSVAKFAYLINDNVWAGEDREIKGFYHSNGGIRMDGENKSLVTSNKEEWICTNSFGCDPCPSDCEIRDSDCFCPGVFTTSGNSYPDLFDFPVPPFDFDGITVDLANIKDKAQNFGVYLPPSEDIDPAAEGYHIIIKNNGTFEARIITSLSFVWGYNEEEDWHRDYFIISDEYLYDTFSIPSSCSVVFIEDNIWIEGELEGKTTIVSADLENPNVDTSIVVTDDLEYYFEGSEDGLALIAEENILISPLSPDNLEMKGIFIAQKGRFGRNHYTDNIKDKLEIIGSVVSNSRVGTQWVSGSVTVSGYKERENYTDSSLIYVPPPFVPNVDLEFGIIKWEELE